MTGRPRPHGGDRPPGPDGLQPERTALAWSRTALGVLANAVLLSLREVGAVGPALAIVPAALAGALALATVLFGRHREAVLRRTPLPSPLAATRAVVLMSCSVATLALVAGGVLLL